MWLEHSTWSLLVALTLVTIAESGYNDNTIGGRGQQASNFKCKTEGYHADPQNCKIYYRCVDYGNGGPLVKFDFECGPGTVFSKSQGDICTHPNVCGRKECGDTSHQSDNTNDIDSNNTHETGTKKPHTPGTTGTTAAAATVVTPSSVQPSQGSTAGWISSTESNTQVPNKPNIGSECKGDGFMADPENCCKFYRCVDEGNGSYRKYEFTCGVGTVWDPKINTCNHAWAANRVGCKVPTDSNPSHKPSDLPSSTQTTAAVTTSSVRPSQGVDSPNSPDTTGTSAAAVTPSSVRPSQEVGSTNAPDTTGTIAASVTASSIRPSQGVGSTDGWISSTESNTQVPNEPNIGSECKRDGFMADPDNCCKFYRCVDEGNGSYRKYEFTCGIGTVWDPKINTCNHAWAANRVGCKVPTDSNPPHKPSDLPSSTQTTAAVTTSSVRPGQEVGSTNVADTTGTTAASVTLSSVRPSQEVGSTDAADTTGTTAAAVTPSSVQPSQEVGSTNAPDTTGTTAASVTLSSVQPNQEAESTNAPDTTGTTAAAVTLSSVQPSQEVGSTDAADTTGTTAASVTLSSVQPNQEAESTNAPDTTGTTAAAVTPSQGVGSTAGSISSTESNTQVPNKPNIGSECKGDGFMADPDNCCKFYRCVDEGNGSYRKYEFTCGVGTVWDPKINTCNHPWAANRVGCKVPTDLYPSHKPSNEPSSTGTTAAVTPSSVSPTQEAGSTAGSIPSTESVTKVPSDSDGSSGVTPSGSDSSVNTPSGDSSDNSPAGGSSIPGQGSTGINPTTVPSTSGQCTPECTNEGFFANEYDCTKFYRCVRAGPSGYAKFEFSCGLGTAWDQGLLTCNYISQVNSCKKNSNNKPSGGGCSGKPAQITDRPESSSEGSSPSSSSSSPSSSDSSTSSPTSSESSSSSTSSSESSSSPTSSSESSSSSPSSSESTSEGSSENASTVKPCDNSTPASNNNGIVCNKEGFYANPSHCDKFYRCVNNGNGFNVYHFDCPPGTIFDPSISVCNYPSSVYPARDCQNGGGTTGPTGKPDKPPINPPCGGCDVTTESTTSPVTETVTKPEEGTTEASTNSTPDESTSASAETTAQSTTSQEAEQSTAVESESSTEAGTETSGTTSSESAETSTETAASTTSQEEQSTTVESGSSTEAGTESAGTTTSQSAEASTETTASTTSQEEQSTTVESGSSTEAGTESAGTTTSQSAETSTETAASTTSQEEQSTTVESGSSTEAGTESSGTTTSESGETSTETAASTTSQEEQSTTVGTDSSSEAATESSGPTPSTESEETTTEVSVPVKCPIGNLTGEQIVLVCPTGFRRHPKYCNIFYQCTSDSKMEVKILSFHCPENMIFDEKKIQCVAENESTDSCSGVKAGARVYRRVESTPTALVDMKQNETLCPGEGYHPYNNEECNNIFYRCKKDSNESLEGYLYKCPENFVFWSISRRCERLTSLPMCSDKSKKNEHEHYAWQLPTENHNRSLRTLRNR